MSGKSNTRLIGFTRDHFLAARGSADLESICRRLAQLISTSLVSDGVDWHARVRAAIDVLRDAGHDLYSFDEDGAGWESWCGDWSAPTTTGELLLEFAPPSWCSVSWRGHEGGVISAEAGTRSDDDA